MIGRLFSPLSTTINENGPHHRTSTIVVDTNNDPNDADENNNNNNNNDDEEEEDETSFFSCEEFAPSMIGRRNNDADSLTEPLISTISRMEGETDSHSRNNSHYQQTQNDGIDDDSGDYTDSLLLSSQFQSPDPRRLLFFKSLYFLSGLSGATWGRFGIIYYNQIKHMTATQIGWCSGIMPLVGFVAMPFWGWVADLIHSRKYVYLLCKAMSTLSLLSLVWAPSFRWIMASIVAMASFRCSGVLDAHTLDFLTESSSEGNDCRSLYGTIRLWTAISWGLGAVVMGWITTAFGFQWNFVLFVAMMTVVLVVSAIGLPARSSSEQEQYDRISRPSQSPSQPDSTPGGPNTEEVAEMLDDNTSSNDPRQPQFRTLVCVICRPTVLLWLLEVAVIGAAMELVSTFLFVYLQNNLHASTTLCGYTVGVTVLFEIPIFLHSKFFLQRLGHDVLFLLAMVAYVIRVGGYTFLTPATVYWILPLEGLHGITFASMWIASIDFSAAIAPREWSTTVQSILSMTMSCVGGGLGPIVGGFVLDQYGPIFMYRGAATIVAVVASCHMGLWMCLGHGHGNTLKGIEVADQQAIRNREDEEEAAIQ
jgi:MFS family permease